MRSEAGDLQHLPTATRQADGSIKLVLRCDFDATSEGHYEHRSTVWEGTNDPPGPNHGVWIIGSHPTGFEGADIIKGFVRDGSDMFDEGVTYKLIVNLHFDTSFRPIISSRRFTCRSGVFDAD